MNRLSLSSLRRKAFAGPALALFLLGIHFCLVGALMPSAMPGMACMGARAAHAEHVAPPAKASGHCAAMAAQAAKRGSHCAAMAAVADPETAPEGPAPAPPCCIALTPVLTPEFAQVPVAPLAVLAVLFDDVSNLLTPEPAAAWPRAVTESPPPLAVLAALSSPRAPPTS